MSSSGEQLLGIDDVSKRIEQALRKGLISAEDTTVNFYDFSVFHERLNAVQSAFPSHWLHTVAIKSNPLTKILSHATGRGFGLEAASFEETLQANVCQAPFTVWDSPVKTEHEIQKALGASTPLYINANGLEELQDLIITKKQYPSANIAIGLRVNPQLQNSAHTSMQVGGMLSKFGEPIAHAERIISVIHNADQKIGLHVHSSSQNLRTDETVQAIKRVYELAISIGWDRIAYFDLGGGYPVNYGFTPVEHIEAYANKLRKALPLLFDGSIKVITEFGRYYHANAGWTISQIADIKRFNQHQTILQHAGADLFLRECYEVGKWPHRFFLHPQRTDKEVDWRTDIGGPLCFGGDYVAKGIELQEAQKGDWLIMLDTGANSYALWSKHCSRPFPKVIGYNDKAMTILKERQSSEDAVALWS